MVNSSAMEETSMSHPCCPNPGVWQQLSTGPLGAHIDTFARKLLDQGYASWTAKSMVHLLADLSRWLQRHALMAMDLNEQRVDAFRQDRYRRYCEIGGHLNPIAYFLLPARVLERHRNAFGSNESFWIDLAQHLRVIWADIQAISTDHPNENVDVILQYTPVVMAAVKLWEGVDPCAPMLPQSLIDELAAVRAAAQQSRAQGCASAAPFAGHPAAPQRRLAH